MRKFILFFLLMTSFLFVGCGGNNSAGSNITTAGDDGSKEITETTETTELKEEIVVKNVKIATFNTHDCENGEKIKEIAEEINNSKADIIALQELDKGAGRSNGKDILKELSDITLPYYYYFPTMNFDGGEYGIGILSKFPISNCENISLPSDKYEPRVLAKAEIDVDGTTLTFYNTHLIWETYDARKPQIDFIKESLKDKTNYILCGDFNIDSFDELETFSNLTNVNSKDNEYKTYKDDDANFSSLDHILISPEISFVKSEMLESAISDHNMLVADVELK